MPNNAVPNRSWRYRLVGQNKKDDVKIIFGPITQSAWLWFVIIQKKTQ